MCGIAGIITRDKHFISEQKMQLAADCLQHRGPEDSGFWFNAEQTAALAHRRLCIIDTSKKGAQPMAYMSRYHIVHNGELYNYIELRQQLEQKGYGFNSHSDTEVIVAAYDAWGTDCLAQFDGMFAFAIWDQQEQQLFAARDRFGEKPFFFSFTNHFCFASEMKALWSIGIAKEVNPALLYNFLTIGYTGNPADPQETFFNGIYKLPRAYFLIYSLPQDQLQLQQYWYLYPEPPEKISEQEAIEKFRYFLTDSVTKRLRSDVPIGTSLSGGLDSSSIVALCHQQNAAEYSHTCFTAVFDGYEKDEKKYAAIVARKYALKHIPVEQKEDITELMARVMHYQEEPISSASALAQFKVFEAAKQQHIKVLLDGQGADELLAGYHKYYKWYWQELYRNKQLKSSGELQAARQAGITEAFTLRNKLAALMPEFAASLLQSGKSKQAYRHPGLQQEFAFAHKQSLYYSTPVVADLNGALYFNTFVSGLEELVRMADRNSMANGTEVRLPFLSHELVRFLFTLPTHFKIHHGRTKWLLRKTMEHELPPEIVWRKDKTGFEPPQKQWMENKRVQEAIHEGKRILVKKGILNSSALQKKIKPHDAYAADNWDWKCWSASFLFQA